MNAALQCLRFTPELPMLLIPDILDSLPPPGSPAAIAVATEHPPQSQLAADTLSTAPEAAPARPSSAGSSTARAPLGGGVVVDEGDATSVMLATSLSASPRGMPARPSVPAVHTAMQCALNIAISVRLK